MNGTSVSGCSGATQRNVLAADTLAHHACLVETEQLVRIVDQQVEVREEIFTEDPANAGIGCLNLSEGPGPRQWAFRQRARLLPTCPERLGRLQVVGDCKKTYRALGFRWSSEASDGSITVIWLPVSTMKSNGPDWLILTGITIRARATKRGVTLAMFPGQCGSALREVESDRAPGARTTQVDA